MKHIRKFNESSEFNIDYIRECFIEYINEHNEVVEGKLNGKQFVEVFIMLPHIKHVHDKYIQTHLSQYYDIADKIKEVEVTTNFYKDMESCIDKVKIGFPDIGVEVSNMESTYSSHNGPQGCTESYESFIKILFHLR